MAGCFSILVYSISAYRWSPSIFPVESTYLDLSLLKPDNLNLCLIVSPSMPLLLCVYMLSEYTNIFMPILVCKHMCVQVKGQRLVSSSVALHFIFEIGSPLNLEISNLARWARQGVTGTQRNSQPFTWCWRSKPRSPCLPSKHYTESSHQLLLSLLTQLNLH